MTPSLRRSLTVVAMFSQLLVSCGAKTGLRVPCEMPVRGTRPAFVLVYEKSSGTVQISPADRLPYGRDYDREQLAWVRSFLPTMGVDALVGATPWPVEDRGTPRFRCPWSDTILSPIADDGAASALRYMINEEFVVRPSGPISQSIEAGVRALRSLPEDVHPRVVVLTNLGTLNECRGEFAWSPGPTDWHFQRVAQFRREGFPTLVVGLRQAADGSEVQRSILEAYAEAGGLARRNGPATWYDFTLDRDELQRAAERAILHPAYCVGRASEGTDEPDTWAMQAPSTGTIPRDTSHREGWDWVDAEQGTIRLYGTPCDRVARARERPRLVTQTWGCYL